MDTTMNDYSEEEMAQNGRKSVENGNNDIGTQNQTNAATRPILTSRITPSPEPAEANVSSLNTPGVPDIPSPPVDSPLLDDKTTNAAASLSQALTVQGTQAIQYANDFGPMMPGIMARFDETVHASQSVVAAAAAPTPSELPAELLTDKQARALLESEEKQDWKRTQKELDQMFDKQSENKFEGIPPFQRPKGLKREISLYPYQQDGVRWLLHQETNPNRVPPFWKERYLGSFKQNYWWVNSITKQFRKTPPKSCLGSILADDMGLGKTLQSISLILSNRPEQGEPRCTLIVAPVSVIANWKTQISQFVQEGELEVAVYHGPKRDAVLNRIKKNQLDVVVCSYETIVSDLKQYEDLLEEKAEQEAEKSNQKKKAKKRAKRNETRDAWEGSDEDDWTPDDSESEDEDDHHLPKSMLKRKRAPPPKKKKAWIFDLLFHRIILDEAHKIRNSETYFFKSMMQISAERKLCLTGTPFVNRPSDIHSLLAFLGAEPLSDKTLFVSMVVQPIMEAKEIGLSRLRTAMSHLALRRTKAVVDSSIQLVPKEVIVRHVEFPEDGFHQSAHSVLYETARSAFISLLKSDDGALVFQNFYAFLVLVLRVRQSCCSGYLVPPEARDMATEVFQQLESGEVDLDALEATELLQKLLKCLKESGDDKDADVFDSECAVCCEVLEEDTAVVLRSCQHVLCQSCLDQIGNNLCCFCRKPYTEKDMIKKSVAEAASKKNSKKKKKAPIVIDEDGEVPPKIQALLDAIEDMQADEKGVVFSQWTSYLDMIQHALEKNGHSTTRIDGSMNAFARIEAMEAFTADDGPRFILCSLHACGTGINLTRGNHVFLVDVWWNLAVEQQAMDRVHRIGQQRPVKAIRFVMKDSLEERMVTLQDAKAALGKASLQKLTKEERKKARITALKDLFQVDEELVQDWQGYYEDEEDEGGDLDGFIVDDDNFE